MEGRGRSGSQWASVTSGQGPIAAPVADVVSSECGSGASCPRVILCALYREHAPDAGGVRVWSRAVASCWVAALDAFLRLFSLVISLVRRPGLRGQSRTGPAVLVAPHLRPTTA